MPTLQALTPAAILAFLSQFPDQLKESDNATALDAALWWTAYREADVQVDGNTTKDWARLFLNGFPGYKTEDDLLSVCEEFAESYETPKEGLRELERNLRDFFALPA